ELALELLLGDVVAAVGALDVLHRGDHPATAERLPERQVRGGRPVVGVRGREEVPDRRVRGRNRPGRRARRPVVRVELVDEARLERRAARAAAGGDARAREVLAEPGEALLPEREIEGALGDVVPEPLVHVLVVEGAERGTGSSADRAAGEGDLA